MNNFIVFLHFFFFSAFGFGCTFYRPMLMLNRFWFTQPANESVCDVFSLLIFTSSKRMRLQNFSSALPNDIPFFIGMNSLFALNCYNVQLKTCNFLCHYLLFSISLIIYWWSNFKYAKFYDFRKNDFNRHFMYWTLVEPLM